MKLPTRKEIEIAGSADIARHTVLHVIERALEGSRSDQRVLTKTRALAALFSIINEENGWTPRKKVIRGHGIWREKNDQH